MQGRSGSSGNLNMDLLVFGTSLGRVSFFESGKGSFPQGCGKVFNFVG